MPPHTTSYTEDLTLQRLGKNHVAARFVFRSEWTPQDRHRCQDHEDWTAEEGERGRGKLCHFDAVFPRAVGVLMDRFKVRDLSLQMSKGRWDKEFWGNGPRNGAGGEYTPGGAEMWVRLPQEGAWESWVGLRRSLSGLYCSSLDAMDETRVHELNGMPMPGEDSWSMENDDVVLRGALPREPVCTENLIPLVKMLPCRSKTGLGLLLHPTRLFQSDYHSISVRAKGTFSADGSVTSFTLEHTVLAVFRPRPDLPSVSTGNPQDKPAANESPAGYPRLVSDWSILSLLLPPKVASDWSSGDTGKSFSGTPSILQGCPIASRSAVHILSEIGGIDRKKSGAPPLGQTYVAGEHTATGVKQGTNTAIAEQTCKEVSNESPEGECHAGVRHTAGASGGGVKEDGREHYISLSLGVKTRSLLASYPSGNDKTDQKATALFFTSPLWGALDNDERKPLENGSTSRDVVTEVTAGLAEGAEAASSSAAVARLDHFLAGRGGSRGVAVSHVVNADPSADAHVHFVQPVPYFMVPLLSTLQARLMPNVIGGKHGHGGHTRLGSLENESDSAGKTRTISESSSPAPKDEMGFAAGTGVSTSPVVSLDLASNITLTPGEGKRPAVVELELWVSADSTVVLGFDFFKRFLAVDNFPPDPSRGFDVPPPVARFSFEGSRPDQNRGSGLNQGDDRSFCSVGTDESAPNEGKSSEGAVLNNDILQDGYVSPEEGVASDMEERFPRERCNVGFAPGSNASVRVVYVYGESALLDIPQPDFSMPFNVITFTSTVITFFLGTAINLLVRKSAAGRKKQKKRKSGKNRGVDNDREDATGQRVGGLVRRAWRRWKHRRERAAKM